MKRLSTALRRALTVVALALIMAACGGSDTVATVDGEAITAEQLTGMRTTYDGLDVLDGAVLRDDLNLLIFASALRAGAEDLGLTITEADIDERIANPPPRWTQNFQQLQATPEIGETRIRNEATLTLVRDGVMGPIVLDAYGSLDEYVAQQPADVLQACVRHVMVATDGEASAALDRIRGGEDLEAVANEISLAPTPDLTPPDSCPVGVGPLGPTFAAAALEAPLGEPFGPVQTDFGWHVIVVDDRVLPTDEAAFLADASSFMNPDAVGFFFTQWFNEVVRETDIEVASNIGRWSPDGLGIAAPGE